VKLKFLFVNSEKFENGFILCEENKCAITFNDGGKATTFHIPFICLGPVSKKRGKICFHVNLLFRYLVSLLSFFLILCTEKKENCIF